MELSPEMRQYFVKEIDYAASMMDTTDNPIEKLYYFSIVYSTASRVMNIEFDPELLLINQVLSNAHNMINSSIKLMREGQLINAIGANLFIQLTASLSKLASNIENKETTYITLQEISTLAYSTSGNGHYLYLRGLLKI